MFTNHKAVSSIAHRLRIRADWIRKRNLMVGKLTVGLEKEIT